MFMDCPANSSTREQAARSADERPLSEPASFPEDYEALSYAGGGALSEIWRARPRRGGAEVALKLLRPDWVDYPVARALLENEAEVGQAVEGRYVIHVLSAELDHDCPYVVMPWLQGASLEQQISGLSRLSYLESLWMVRQCAEGLEELRQAGFSHGDVKPSNLMLAADGSLTLIDLGFARRLRKSDGELSPSMDVLTGTPEYLAPEALSTGWQGGVARDVYSLGVTLYRLLTGRLPFQDDAPDELLRNKLGATPPSVRQLAPEIPRELDQLVGEMLAKQPIRRPQSLQRLIRRLVELELEALRHCEAAA